MATPRLTIGIPVYKRLDLLPNALRSVAAQTYPNIELLISDNGQNGEALVKLIEQNYDRPYILRVHPTTVDITANFNTLVNHATGEYFTLLCDDDEITPDFAAEMVGLLEAHPTAALAIPRHERIDEQGKLEWKGMLQRPERMTGESFVEAWSLRDYDLVSSAVTHMARTAEVRRMGGFRAFPRAIYSDDLLWVQLSLGRDVVLAQRAAFRWRVDAASTGHTSNWQQVAEANRQYQQAIDTDPSIQAYARTHAKQWPKLRRYIVSASTSYYLSLWSTVYRTRLSTGEWLRAGFALPPIAAYYRRVLLTLLVPAPARALIGDMRLQMKRRIPALYTAYRRLMG